MSLEGGIDIGGALSFGRGLPFLGGIPRPALGASSNNARRAAANEGLDAIGARYGYRSDRATPSLSKRARLPAGARASPGDPCVVEERFRPAA